MADEFSETLDDDEIATVGASSAFGELADPDGDDADTESDMDDVDQGDADADADDAS